MKQRITLSLLTLFTLIPHQLASQGNLAKKKAAERITNTMLLIYITGPLIVAGGAYLYLYFRKNQPQNPASKLKKILNKIDLDTPFSPENSKPFKEFANFLTNNREVLREVLEDHQLDENTKNKLYYTTLSPQVQTIFSIKKREQAIKQVLKLDQETFKAYVEAFINQLRSSFQNNTSDEIRTNRNNLKKSLVLLELLDKYKNGVFEVQKTINQKAKEFSLTTDSTYILTTVLQELEPEKQKLLLDNEHFYLGKHFNTAYPGLVLNSLDIEGYTPPTSS